MGENYEYIILVSRDYILINTLYVYSFFSFPPWL